MTPQQCRAARALLDFSHDDLALRARVDVSVLQSFEAGSGAPDDSVDALRTAVEEAGAMLITSGSNSPAGGEGVRLAKPSERSVDTIVSEVVQYPEFMENDAPPGAGG
ncbi:XRE family transcriptional regulator [Rhizobium sp. S152]|uniref:XRE family transcriptional regulator n=1 Tax=Rhizobium sp. S152 TaxID=3055038 RepID=UPI0025A9B1E4|nr:XRE family transcriptional regulator [Rhizobium sp. S152]MDM9626281.1 XRE family transcriptional regulator [Rhizobium sp. S152]